MWMSSSGGDELAPGEGRARSFRIVRGDDSVHGKAHGKAHGHAEASPSDDPTNAPVSLPARGRWSHLDQRARTEEWLERMRAGDENALESMVRACYAPVATVAFRYTGSRELAEEVTQDVFVRVWEQRERLTISGTLMGYLFAAARHRSLNVRATLHARATHVGIETTLPATRSHDDPAHAYDAAELSRTLRFAFDRLAPRGREVFLLSRRDGLTPAEIAATLGIGVQTVYTLLARALEALHRAVDHRA
jgi:RNA polymerase sigma factor (sigma-70 family)